ncbi:hypothetical protein QJS10_CPA01g00578 [Acorus calamus]|uniref:Protein FLX-like 1 n=1 Tax=Acorus calamus TaxID=4465 RepID=A0AAV9FL51_ACOCL|nr:hypothetical protein QJS10_CPA01g00578 [Acorus calamus]
MRAGHPPPPHPLFHHPHHHHLAAMEDRLAVQHHEIQSLLADNQRLAATHVALKQELASATHELRRASHSLASLRAEGDARLRDALDRSSALEAELRAADSARAELDHSREELRRLDSARQEASAQAAALSQELGRVSADLQRVPALKEEIEVLKHEIQRARAAIEYEKKAYADNYEQGQAMEKNFIAMAREVEKLRVEIGNSDNRGRASVSAGTNPGANYGNPDAGYGGNAYPAGYGVNPVPGSAEAGAPYGSGHVSGHGAWGAYDMQRAHGRR